MILFLRDKPFVIQFADGRFLAYHFRAFGTNYEKTSNLRHAHFIEEFEASRIVNDLQIKEPYEVVPVEVILRLLQNKT